MPQSRPPSPRCPLSTPVCLSEQKREGGWLPPGRQQVPAALLLQHSSASRPCPQRGGHAGLGGEQWQMPCEQPQLPSGKDEWGEDGPLAASKLPRALSVTGVPTREPEQRGCWRAPGSGTAALCRLRAHGCRVPVDESSPFPKPRHPAVAPHRCGARAPLLVPGSSPRSPAERS